ALFAFFLLLGIGPAGALTVDQARQQCRETVGHPIFKNCLSAQRKGASDALHEACRTKAKLAVSACLHKALNAAHGRANIPLALPQEKPLEIPLESSVPAAFVAPPRTITDITAILDAEKPDRQKLEELKVTADAEPAPGKSKQDLAWFYYNRGSAR